MLQGQDDGGILDLDPLELEGDQDPYQEIGKGAGEGGEETEGDGIEGGEQEGGAEEEGDLSSDEGEPDGEERARLEGRHPSSMRAEQEILLFSFWVLSGYFLCNFCFG